ncbi:lipid A-modifier LpxR family protein [Maricaulis parjimensis]|uniref:lipid A-modifier LpxR family protein n=1 Tax=Maricaulis parjimensis TaxID=144023 RepID=UPI00193A4FFF|nr:lipid A-modifier LpxR family protein [Maricaulis parjimensis]
MRLGRTAEIVTAGVIALGGISYMLTLPGYAETGWASSSHMIQDQFRAEGRVEPLSPEAARVALSALSRQDDPLRSDSLAGLTAAHGQRVDLGQAGSLEVAVLDDQTADPARALFAPDSDPYSPIVLERGRREATLAVNYQRVFEQPGYGGELDVSFTPRAGVSVGPDGSAAGAGAEVRVGQYLQGSGGEQPRWYVFAGADRRALMYNPREGMDFTSAVQLTDRQVVGDAQAGIAMRVGEVDLSLAYVRREYTHVAGVTSFDETEEFGAVSVNWTW